MSYLISFRAEDDDYNIFKELNNYMINKIGTKYNLSKTVNNGFRRELIYLCRIALSLDEDDNDESMEKIMEYLDKYLK